MIERARDFLLCLALFAALVPSRLAPAQAAAPSHEATPSQEASQLQRRGTHDEPPAIPQDRSARAADAAARLEENARRETERGFLEGGQIEEQLARRVDVVLLLDCSGSMRPALDSARTQFWRIASSIASAEPRPKLRIGLMAYGLRDQEFPMAPLSEDLVAVFDELLRLDSAQRRRRMGRRSDGLGRRALLDQRRNAPGNGDASERSAGRR